MNQEGDEVRIEAHGEIEERDFNEGGGGRQRFLSESRLTARVRQLEPVDTW